jgi:transcriptional regulator with XRE-family HTH domain
MDGMAAVTGSLGRAIRGARERRHLTQQQLADIVGVDRKTVDNWENERTTPRNRMAALVQWAPELGGEETLEPPDPRERELYRLLLAQIEGMSPEEALALIEGNRRRVKRRSA